MKNSLCIKILNWTYFQFIYFNKKLMRRQTYNYQNPLILDTVLLSVKVDNI